MNTSVIVTGGAQGIGSGIARYLLARGLQVVVADCDGEAGEEFITETAPAAREKALFVATDVADETAVAAMVAQSVARFGGVSALVNNAGIGGMGTPLEELSLAAWLRVINTNLTGCFLCAKHCAPHLRAARGAIVNIASTRALQSEPNSEAYAASKGGIVALTHAMALSLGPAVRVNCISPGWIDVSGWQKRSARHVTELRPEDHAQQPCGRVGAPDDIAALVAFLIGDQAGFITGQNFVVDGGMTKKMIYID
jgi:NAD(P)-dependent dehydrogenase (short-subunit alcohol dehydrogenase family)